MVHDDRQQQHMWVLNNTNQKTGLVNTHRVNLYCTDCCCIACGLSSRHLPPCV